MNFKKPHLMKIFSATILLSFLFNITVSLHKAITNVQNAGNRQ